MRLTPHSRVLGSPKHQFWDLMILRVTERRRIRYIEPTCFFCDVIWCHYQSHNICVWHICLQLVDLYSISRYIKNHTWMLWDITITGSWFYQTNECTIIREIDQNCHTFKLCDHPAKRVPLNVPCILQKTGTLFNKKHQNWWPNEPKNPPTFHHTGWLIGIHQEFTK